MKQLDEYNALNDLGKNGIHSREYNKIRVYVMYDIKHDMRYKERCVADRHLTKVPIYSVYSGLA